MDYTITIGGEAGQGLQTIGSILAKVLSRSGFHVFTSQDYMSRIRGGHNFYQIRFSDKEISALKDGIDILVALDRNTIDIHSSTVKDEGIIIYDADYIKETFDEHRFLHIPFEKIAIESGGSKIISNTVATSAVMGMFNLDLAVFDRIVRSMLKKKGPEIIDRNIASAKAGYDYAAHHCNRCDMLQPTKPSQKSLMLINGTQGIGLGALMSGCKFYSAYPMTPSTGVMTFIASKAQDYGIVVEQVEDEIAAINMALGASFAGVRAMTGSSGGGFALMVEGLSLAGMTETPIVIAEVQRPGPATGFPTRTEQGDLMFVLYSGHGEFPRVIFAPGTPEQAFYLTNKAFELAEKYQIPAFIQSDQYLSDSEWTFEQFETEHLMYHDYRLRADALEKMAEYKRYAYTETGVTPLAVPGESRHVVVADSDEHDEEGHIVEDAETRIKMTDKRLFKKMDRLRKEIAPPFLYGSQSPEILLIGFGSTYGVMKEVVDILSTSHDIAMLHFSEVYPFPLTDRFDYLSIVKQAQQSICIENNATSQFASLMRMETGFECTQRINKYDGRPFTIDGLLGELNGYIK